MHALSRIYEFVIRLRNWCYDAGIFREKKVSVPVISVGNITAGGTGKTPFIEYLIRYFLGKGKRLTVLTRGYRRRTRGPFILSDGKTVYGTFEQSGDEPVQIARKFQEISVVVDSKRTRGATIAMKNFKPDILLLDDGFQHRALARTLDIVLIDGTMPLPEMIPAGSRREPLSSLRRADIVAVTRTREAVNVPPGISPAISVIFKPVSLRNMTTGDSLAAGSVRGKSCTAFCGVGNPMSFLDILKEMGLDVRELIPYPDHYPFGKQDIDEIVEKHGRNRAEVIVTTEKDSMRLPSGAFPRGILFALLIEAVVTRGEEILEKFLDNALEAA